MRGTIGNLNPAEALTSVERGMKRVADKRLIFSDLNWVVLFSKLVRTDPLATSNSGR